MYLADAVGIRVFATGGLGGVHRGVNETFDISADLLELASTPVAVVCAGVKSILDIQKTLEYLETNSVSVIVYGNTINFPGFFTTETIWKAHTFTQSLNEIANIINCSRDMGLPTATIIACPIPKEHAAEGKMINEAIEAALMECKEVGVTSKNVTPFLLKRVNELTAGASLKTNIALLENNAHIAAKLANVLAEEERKLEHADEPKSTTISSTMNKSKENGKKAPSVVVIGASILDFEATTSLDVQNDGGTYPGRMIQRCGGVGRNHADALTRLGIDVHLISVVGDDSHAEFVRSRCKHMDLTNVLSIKELPTATYTAFAVKGNVQYGISNIDRIIEEITPEVIKQREHLISDADYVLLDGNIPVATINTAVSIADFYGTKVWYEPTAVAKMRKIFDAGVDHMVDIISPNLNEFAAYCSLIDEKLPDNFLTTMHANEIFEHLWSKVNQYLRSLEALIVTIGPKGTILLKRDGSSITRHQLPPPLSPEIVVSTSGAGDCFNSGLLAGILYDLSIDESLCLAQKCAASSLQSTEAVPESISDFRAELKKSQLSR
uniref:Pseudouridine-metabolizing protein n=2 Tax=Ascaris TaxID=6251 RepID=F1KX06_ASCSU